MDHATGCVKPPKFRPEVLDMLKSLARTQPQITISDEIKQVVVARRDLGLDRGKFAAQVSHASVSALFEALASSAEMCMSWRNSGSKTVVLRVDSEGELLETHKNAVDAGIPSRLIRDAGRTQVKEGTATAVGIGPWNSEDIDRLTKNLKLYG
jgi:PTH2 family peptidyl-tRNA hydrolase